jgi:hypothetical protein
VSSESPTPPGPSFARRSLALFGAIALVAFLLVLGRMVYVLSRAPKLGPEVPIYMALAIEWEEKEPVELYRRTFDLARSELPAEVFQELSAGSVAAEGFGDAQAFHERLPFFRGEVVYTVMLRWLNQLGRPLSAATWWIPLAAYVMIGLLALAWCVGHVPLLPAALIALGVTLTPALIAQSNLPGGGGLTAVLVCLGAYFLVELRMFAFGAAILTLAIGAGASTLVLIVALACAIPLCMTRDQRPGLIGLLLWIAISVAAYVGLQRFSGDYGWWPRFQDEFVAGSVHPATLATTADWAVYKDVLTQQVRTHLGPGGSSAASLENDLTLLFVYAALAPIGLVIGLRARARHGRECALLMALWVAGVVQFLLRPRPSDGLLVAFHVLVPLAVLALIARELRGEPPPPARSSARPSAERRRR